MGPIGGVEISLIWGDIGVSLMVVTLITDEKINSIFKKDNAMNAAVKQQTLNDTFQVEPVLRKVLVEAEQDHKELQEMFQLMGWGNLPDQLKIEIKDDVAAMIKELQGQYSTCDPYVHKRRQSVTYWVSCYQDGICSLETAIQALKVRKL